MIASRGSNIEYLFNLPEELLLILVLMLAKSYVWHDAASINQKNLGLQLCDK